MVEDSDLDDEIGRMLSLMKRNPAYWSEIKDRLVFLSSSDCIEIKEISLALPVRDAVICIRVNGMITIDEEEFLNISQDIEKIVSTSLEGVH